MLNGKKIIVVMSAHNDEKTLRQTYGEIAGDIVDAMILVDDQSRDRPVQLTQNLGIRNIVVHDDNLD